MKTPQIPPLAGMTPLGLQIKAELRTLRRDMKEAGIKRTSCFNGGLDRQTYMFNARAFELETKLRDQAALAQRKANSPLMAPAPQIPCDHGLFSDERDQLELATMPMFHDAIEEE